MAESWLRYDRMVEQALRGVVRKALSEAGQRGLPGDHHFYITFHTDRPGELIKLLQLCADQRVNVVSVEHHRLALL